MTWTKKQKLPALHQSGKVKNPDMPEVEQQNYTSTVLKYANLALPFSQLETNAKRVVPAINELYENRTIANPEELADQDPLNTVQIAGTVYKIEGGGGGGGYTSGAGIYFTGNNNSVINADAGRLYRTTQEFAFSTNEGPSEGVIVPCWEDSGTTVDGHTVYQTHGGTYKEPSGDSVCTFTVSGYNYFTVYAKQNPDTSSYRYLVFGSKNEEIDLEHDSGYDTKCQNWTDSDYIGHDYYLNGESCTVQLMYHKEPYIVVNEQASTPTDDRAYAYVVLGSSYVGGEYFNDYANNKATGVFSHAEGESTRATGNNSHAEGLGTLASGNNTHAEGYSTEATASYSHAEGDGAVASGSGSHAEGNNTLAQGTYSHAEGTGTKALGYTSHAEGNYSVASGDRSHAEGTHTTASGENSHAEGRETQATALRAHAEGGFTLASADNSHAEGNRTQATADSAHAEGYETQATGYYAHSEGITTKASGTDSHAEGTHTVASADHSHAEGSYTTASGENSHAEGEYAVASGESSHAEGHSDTSNPNTASGVGSHAEGGFTQATADFAHAEGRFTIASGLGSHAEGYGGYGGQYNTATGIGAHAEGSGNLVSGNCGHVEGTRNTVYSESGHADGSGNKVYGRESHATGSGNIVGEQSGYVEGAGNRNIAFSAHVEGGGNKNTYKAHISHTEGAGNTNHGYQAHLEGSGNFLSGEESHVEGAGNMLHGHKSHVEGGGNIAYTFGSHIEGKHNTAVGYGHHAEGINNYIGFNGTPRYFSYGTNYEVGDIVGVDITYLGSTSTYPETNTHYLYRCITAPGQIQQSSSVNIITPDIWASSTTYAAGAVVQLSDVGFYYNSSSESVTETMPTAGWPWNRITDILSPFKTSGRGYYILDCNEVYGANKIAIVSDSVQPMWEPLSNTSGGHVEGVGNIAIGDYQHVQGKFNVADSAKAFIIGNGTATDARSNALTVDWLGNTIIAGDLTTGVTLNTTAQAIGAAINEISVRVPTPPTADGHYTLSLTITNGVPTYSWVSS